MIDFMKRSVVFLFVLLFSVGLSAEIRLPAIVGDNMVLQQSSDVCIWGCLAKTVADDDGRWEVYLRTPAASFDKHTVSISDGKSISLKNILIGEVWLCSGQSNMEMMIQGGRDCPVENSQRIVVESAKYPDIRLFQVKIDGALRPKDDVTGQWNEASPMTVKSFSAVGYLFGKNLYDALNIPSQSPKGKGRAA